MNGSTRVPVPKSAREGVYEALSKKSHASGPPDVVPTPVDEPPNPNDRTPEKSTGTDQDAPKPGDEPIASPSIDKGKKTSPWKLYDAEKKARAAAEAEVQRLKSSVVPEQERTDIEARAVAAENRAQELENEIRFTNYSKSAEFKDKYQVPYEKAWQKATAEMSEISVTDSSTGELRAFDPQDMLQLVQLPLGQAREVADATFGKFANEAMAYRKEIRGLFDQQKEALKEAQVKGGERDKSRQEEYNRNMGALSGELGKTWQEMSSAVTGKSPAAAWLTPQGVGDGKTPTPEESEFNSALDTAKKLVQEAWKASPTNPKLNPEERRKAVAQHNAIYHRAIAYGPMKLQIGRLTRQLQQANKDLASYKGSTPGTGGSQRQQRPSGRENAHDGLLNAIKARAH